MFDRYPEAAPIAVSAPSKLPTSATPTINERMLRLAMGLYLSVRGWTPRNP